MTCTPRSHAQRDLPHRVDGAPRPVDHARLARQVAAVAAWTGRSAGGSPARWPRAPRTARRTAPSADLDLHGHVLDAERLRGSARTGAGRTSGRRGGPHVRRDRVVARAERPDVEVVHRDDAREALMISRMVSTGRCRGEASSSTRVASRSEPQRAGEQDRRHRRSSRSGRPPRGPPNRMTIAATSAASAPSASPSRCSHAPRTLSACPCAFARVTGAASWSSSSAAVVVLRVVRDRGRGRARARSSRAAATRSAR